MNRSLLRYLGRSRSLGSRLSRSLALQILIGLTVVSLVVYAMITRHLQARQVASMDRLEAFVEHLVLEAQASGDSAALDHMLEDFMIGHDDLSLALTSSEGTVFYGESESTSAPDQLRTLRFVLPTPADARTEGASARLSLNTADDDALLERLAWTLASTALLGALAGALGATWRVRRGLLPLADLDRQLQALDASTLDQRLSGSAQPSELQPLVARFNELLQRLDGAYRELEGYNANVAHELKTPLATLVSTCELGLRGIYDEAALRELLASNLEELERLTAVVRSMLFLSTVERGTRAGAEPIPSLAAVARDVAEYHEAVIEEAGLQLHIVGDTTIDGNVMLLRQAVSNLLSNATRHAAKGSELRIVIEHRGDPVESFSLSVINRGETVPSEHLDRLFERFYRIESKREQPASLTDEAPMHSGGSRRHGLGLPIVAAIARMHGGQPFAESTDGVTRVGFTLSQQATSTL